MPPRPDHPLERILVVYPISGGCLTLAQHAAEALLELGYPVEILRLDQIYLFQRRLFQQTSVSTSLFYQMANELFLEKAFDWHPELVLVMPLAPIFPDPLQRVREKGILTAHWFPEDYHLFNWPHDGTVFDPFSTIPTGYDFVFTIQTGEVHLRFKALGTKQCHLLPTACHPKVHRSVRLSPTELSTLGSDLCFVGYPYKNRIEIFPHLTEFNFSIWGPRWNQLEGSEAEYQRLLPCIRGEGKWVSSDSATKIFNASKIVLNFHSTDYQPGIFLEGDFVNTKLFEIAGCGAFQVVDDRRLVGQYFEKGKEIVCYQSVEELKELVRYYLNHPQEREQIARRGQERAYKEHTYHHRMQEMMNVIRQNS